MLNEPKTIKQFCDELRVSGCATADDVLVLRRIVMADGQLDRGEVEVALATDRKLVDRSSEWVWWLREIIVDHLFGIGMTRPELSSEQANWLLAAVQPLNGNDSRARLEVLVRVVETASLMPDVFYHSVLRALAAAVIDNQHHQDQETVICADDAAQIRRVLYASAGDGNFSISRLEAEFLFELNDRTSESGNSPEWTQLFVQAINNHLMASFGNASVARHVAFQKSLVAPRGFWGRVIEDLPGLIRSPSDRMDAHYSDINETFATDTTEAQRVTDGETKWVFERIAKNSRTDATEKALLDSLQLDKAA